MDQFVFIFTELSSESLTELFPESDGVNFPRIRIFKYEPCRQLDFLRRIVDDEMVKFDTNSSFAVRGHVIIGWMYRDSIRPISNLFGETNNVFDTLKNKFVSLSRSELKQLGVNRRLSFVLSQADAADLRRETEQAKLQASNEASHLSIQQANLQANHEVNALKQTKIM